MNIIISTILTGIAIVSSFFGLNNLKNSTDTKLEVLDQKIQTLEQAPVAGAFSPSGGLTYRLQTSAATTDTSITLSSFKNRSNIALTMTLLGTDVIYGTLDPQTTRSEFISCTGISQNSNGTATLTTCTRGLSDIGASTASTTLRKSHPGQSIFILSDSPALFNEYAKRRTDETISGLWNFNSYLPTSNIAATTSNQFITKAVLDATTNQGAATSTETNGGIVELGTLTEQASSFDGGASKPTILQTKNSTSTCQVVGSYNIVASTTTGKLDKNCFDGSLSYLFTGLNNFTASTSFVGTTTIAASNVLSRALILNNLTYAFPSSRGSISTVLTENGSGTLTWSVPSVAKYTYASTSQASIGAGATLNSNSIGVPTNTLTASSTISVDGSVQCVSGGSSANNCTIELIDESSNVYATHSLSTAISKTDYINFKIVVLSNNSTSAQSFTISGFKFENNATLAFSSSGTSAINWTGAKSFKLRFVTGAGASNTGILYPYSIIITP